MCKVTKSGPRVHNWISNFQLPRRIGTKPTHFWGVLSGTDVGLCLCIFFSFYVGTKVRILDSTCHAMAHIHMRTLEGLEHPALPSCGCEFPEPAGANLSCFDQKLELLSLCICAHCIRCHERMIAFSIALNVCAKELRLHVLNNLDWSQSNACLSLRRWRHVRSQFMLEIRAGEERKRESLEINFSVLPAVGRSTSPLRSISLKSTLPNSEESKRD